jgi:phosphohistidine phosphatase
MAPKKWRRSSDPAAGSGVVSSRASVAAVVESKRLALLRHAKASSHDLHIDDHERPLTGRGRRAAAQVGAYLRQHDLGPALVLCSSAVRTRQTLELLELETDPEVVVADDLYGATAGELLDRLRCLDDGFSSVLVIGHNPGLQDLAVALVGDDPGIVAFPTGALAELSAAIACWKDLDRGVATLDVLVTPKDLA